MTPAGKKVDERPRHNVASRLLKILQHASEGLSTTTSWEVWADILGIETTDRLAAISEVGHSLQLLREQVQRIRRGMELSEVPVSASNFEPALKSIEQALSLENLSAPWQRARSLLDPAGVLSQLAWCRDIIPDEGPPWDSNSRAKLQREVLKLRQEIESSDYPAIVRTMLLDHVAAILRAIWEYPILGPESLSKAMLRIATSANENPEVYEESMRTPAGRRTSRLLAKLRASIPYLPLVTVLFNAGLKMAEFNDGNQCEIRVITEVYSPTNIMIAPFPEDVLSIEPRRQRLLAPPKPEAKPSRKKRR